MNHSTQRYPKRQRTLTFLVWRWIAMVGGRSGDFKAFALSARVGTWSVASASVASGIERSMAFPPSDTVDSGATYGAFRALASSASGGSASGAFEGFAPSVPIACSWTTPFTCEHWGSCGIEGGNGVIKLGSWWIVQEDYSQSLLA